MTAYFLAGQFGANGVILHLGADSENVSDGANLPRYIATASFSAFNTEKELFFAGKCCKFKIQNIFIDGFGQSHRKELSALNVLQRLLENGNVEWISIDDEISMIQQYIDLKLTGYVRPRITT